MAMTAIELTPSLGEATTRVNATASAAETCHER